MAPPLRSRRSAGKPARFKTGATDRDIAAAMRPAGAGARAPPPAPARAPDLPRRTGEQAEPRPAGTIKETKSPAGKIKTAKSRRRRWQQPPKGCMMPFPAALAYAHQLGLKSQKQWKKWASSQARPENMPFCPERVYKDDGWDGYRHWLGIKKSKSRRRRWQQPTRGCMMPFSEALAYARQLGLKSQKQWTKWASSQARPENMPSGPARVYKDDGWDCWRHWLGTEDELGPTNRQRAAGKMPFREALAYVRKLGLKGGQKQWRKWSKSGARPPNVPSRPSRTYSSSWEGWQHWLGTK